MTPNIQPILHAARQQLEETYGDRLVRIVLYGSRARGDAHPESDVDMLVVLRGPIALYDETKRLVLLALDLYDRYGHNVSFQPFSEADYRRADSSFMRNVQTEGLDV